jgi:hypothetical protein
MDAKRVIAQLRAKAESSTFPEEADAFRKRADRLHAKYFPPSAEPPRFGARVNSGPFSGAPMTGNSGGDSDSPWAHVDGIIFDGGPLVDGKGVRQPNGSTVFRTRSGMRVTFVKPEQA